LCLDRRVSFNDSHTVPSAFIPMLLSSHSLAKFDYLCKIYTQLWTFLFNQFYWSTIYMLTRFCTASISWFEDLSAVYTYENMATSRYRQFLSPLKMFFLLGSMCDSLLPSSGNHWSFCHCNQFSSSKILCKNGHILHVFFSDLLLFSHNFEIYFCCCI
jgi:hypothetical protein